MSGGEGCGSTKARQLMVMMHAFFAYRINSTWNPNPRTLATYWFPVQHAFGKRALVHVVCNSLYASHKSCAFGIATIGTWLGHGSSTFVGSCLLHPVHATCIYVHVTQVDCPKTNRCTFPFYEHDSRVPRNF